MYFWYAVLAIPVFLLIWLLRPEEDFIRWLYPPFTLICASWAWRLRRGANLGRIERETIVAVTVFFTAKLTYHSLVCYLTLPPGM